MDDKRYCRDCARAERVDDPVFAGLWQLNCPYRFGVTYSRADDCRYYKRKEDKR